MNDFINMLIGHVTNSFVSTFVLGILTGWLIEWLFYNFIWKNSRTVTKSEEEIVTSPITKGVIDSKTVNNDKSEKIAKQVSAEIKEVAEPQKMEIVEENQTTEYLAETQDKRVSQDELKANKQPKLKKEQKSGDPDDFTKLVGIGPSMDKRLKAIGIKSFLQLSEMSVEALMEQLTTTGARVNNKTLMKSWAKQATLANLADFEALKVFQNTLKKG